MGTKTIGPKVVTIDIANISDDFLLLKPINHKWFAVMLDLVFLARQWAILEVSDLGRGFCCAFVDRYI